MYHQFRKAAAWITRIVHRETFLLICCLVVLFSPIHNKPASNPAVPDDGTEALNQGEDSPQGEEEDTTVEES